MKTKNFNKLTIIRVRYNLRDCFVEGDRENWQDLSLEVYVENMDFVVGCPQYNTVVFVPRWIICDIGDFLPGSKST